MASLGRRIADSAACKPVAVRRTKCIVRAATALPAEFKAVKPVGDRVFVKVDKEESKSTGGVLLPSMAQKKPTAGNVLAVGKVDSVKTGDKVVYSEFSATELKMQGEEHVLLKEEDIIGVLPTSDKISELKPLSDRVLIKISKASSKTKGGVLLTNEAAEKPNFGTIVAVGPGKKDEDGKVEAIKLGAGNMVMFSKYSGMEFSENDDEDYIIIRESDVLGVLA